MRPDRLDATSRATADIDARENFSLVLGGPLFQLFRRTHLSGDGLQLLRQRLFVILGLAWPPLLVLSVLEGQALD